MCSAHTRLLFDSPAYWDFIILQVASEVLLLPTYFVIETVNSAVVVVRAVCAGNKDLKSCNKEL